MSDVTPEKVRAWLDTGQCGEDPVYRAYLRLAAQVEAVQVKAVAEQFRLAAKVVVEAQFINHAGYNRWLNDWAEDIEAGRPNRALVGLRAALATEGAEPEHDHDVPGWFLTCPACSPPGSWGHPSTPSTEGAEQ
jgi:hypothetical protein